MRVHFSRMAQRDLTNIAEYIARRNSARAMTFIDSLVRRCKSIGEFPEAAPRIDGVNGNARMVHFRGYLILYRVSRGEVKVARIWHSARRRAGVFKDMNDEGY